MSHDQFLTDRSNNLHNADYLLDKLVKLSFKYLVKETLDSDLYNLSIFEKSNMLEPLCAISGESKGRLEFGFTLLEFLIKHESRKVVLTVVK